MARGRVSASAHQSLPLPFAYLVRVCACMGVLWPCLHCRPVVPCLPSLSVQCRQAGVSIQWLVDISNKSGRCLVFEKKKIAAGERGKMIALHAGARLIAAED